MMSRISFLRANIARILRDRSGNFAMMTAILMPVAIGAAGLAVDISNVALSQQQLQEASDAAALATASALADGKIDMAAASAFAKDFLAGQMANYVGDTTALRNATTATATESTSGSATSYNVSVSSSYSMQLSGLAQVIGFKTTDIGAVSQTTSGHQESQGALSMYLVLDRSGSMSFITDQVKSYTTKCQNYTSDNWREYPNLQSAKPCYTRKIEALKAAATGLFSALNAADTSPNHDLIRMGAVSYTDEMQKPKTINWGTGDASSYVSALPALPTGGTDASKAMETAYNALKATTDGSDTETQAHKDRNHTSFTRYIVLMTDGEMTGKSSSWNSALDQDVRNACAEAKADGIQIFTVAFMAPQKGKDLLLDCASAPGNAYQPDNMAKLVADFGEIAAKATSSLTRLTN
ncbi:pilus assembly protein TadG [Rhizobium sullae]|uniref:Pilus assembly protein TadG n=2 Tax=Rhizobium sullae TaxID=50338 RepID=A0A2N0D6N6_RHISU|nr:pilus assembly protein TadG [Rhizobium sullae]